MNAVYSLFLRNWENGRATVDQIDQAVEKGLITSKDADIIKATEQNPV